MNTLGIAKEFKKRLSDKLKGCMFSVNRGSNNPEYEEKILNIVVYFVYNDAAKIVTQHNFHVHYCF